MKKQKQNDNTILAALETLAATFPWDNRILRRDFVLHTQAIGFMVGA